MIALIASIALGWLLLRLLLPRMSAPIYSEPPPPQLVVHVHLHLVAVKAGA